MNKRQNRIRREQTLKLFSFIFLLIFFVVILFSIDNMLISFVLAVVFYYLLAPLVDKLERRGLSRSWATLLPFLASGALIAVAISLILPPLVAQLVTFESALPTYQQDLVSLVARIETRLKAFTNYSQFNLSETVNTWIVHKTAEWSITLPSIFTQSLTVALLGPLFAFFMLLDGRQISRSLLTLVPNNFFELTLHLRHKINEQMGGFIRARFLEAAIVGCVVWLGLQVLAFPYVTLLACFAALTNLIPYVGPIIGAVPAVLLALLSDDARIFASMNWNLAAVIFVYFFAQLIDILFIIPLVVARSVNLHPATVIVVIIIGSELMGVLGMVISIPVMSMLKLIFSAVYQHITEHRT